MVLVNVVFGSYLSQFKLRICCPERFLVV